MKNGYMIIDAHAHVFPDKIAGKAVDGISHFYDLPMAYQGKVAEMLENGTNAGIDQFLICSPATTVSQVRSINAFLASCMAAYPMCTAFGTLHPKSEQLEDDFKQLQNLHLRGIKLHPDFQNFPIDDPAAYPMYEMIQESGLPILMHMGDSRSDLSHPLRLAMILRQFPRLRIIAAHFGGWGCWKEAHEILKPDSRLRIDTSSSLPFLPSAKICALIHHFGAENCFFGVDYPMWNYSEELERFFSLSLSDQENRKILSENLNEWLSNTPKF
ncbi:MAG: amidohydrolase family protein [Ruminococcus sp.]|nr:amidohydrolase family protein [Ruminococcus sp.]